MAIEGGKHPENPWAHGEEYERQVGPEETKRIRNKVSGIDEAPAPDARTPEGRTRFFEQLQACGGSLTERFTVDSSGSLVWGSRYHPGTAKGIPGPLSLLSFARSHDQTWTAESVREAAQWINDLFPEIEFTFDEDRAKGTFQYTASLPEKSETV